MMINLKEPMGFVLRNNEDNCTCLFPYSSRDFRVLWFLDICRKSADGYK